MVHVAQSSNHPAGETRSFECYCIPPPGDSNAPRERDLKGAVSMGAVPSSLMELCQPHAHVWIRRRGCFPTCANMYFFLIFVLKPKARTGISKPYNVKQIKTTNAQEAEAAIRCLLEARGGRCSPRAPSRFCSSSHILAKRGLEKNRTLFLEAVFSKSTL